MSNREKPVKSKTERTSLFRLRTTKRPPTAVSCLNVEVIAGDVVAPNLFPSVIHRAQIILLYLGMFLISCSRERNEDEMTASLRGETLKEVCYITFFAWVAYRVVASCVSADLSYIVHDEPFVTPFIVWILYYGRFENKLKQLRRASRNFTL